MTPAIQRFLHAAVFAAAATGLVLLWTRYVAPPDEQSDPPPIDATAQHLHVLMVPVVVFVFGVLWPTHILPHLRTGRRLRVSGLLLLVLALPMVASGYGVQVATGEDMHAVLGWAHAGSAVAWLAIFSFHCLRTRWAGSERDVGKTTASDTTR